MKKRTLALLLSLLLFIMPLAACGGAASASQEAAPSPSSSSSAAQKAEEDAYTVTMLIEGEPQQDHERIMERVNELTLRDLNLRLDLIVVPWGNAQQQKQLMLSSGEKLDLISMRIADPVNFMNAGQIIDINQLIDEYGQDIKASWGEEFYKSCAIGDFVYGVPNVNEVGPIPGFALRTDLCEKYNIDTTTLKTLDDFDAVWALIKENEPGITVIHCASDQPPGGQLDPVDLMTDGLAVLDNRGIGTTEIIPITQSESYRALLNKTREWYQAGYINQDSITTTVGFETAFKAGDNFAAMMMWHPNSPNAFGEQKLTYVFTGEHTLPSYGASNATYGIATNSKEPAKAMQMLNYLHSEKGSDVVQLLNWGEENVDWVYVDEANNVIDYPDGVTEDSVGYHARYHAFLPNQFLSSYWNGMTRPGVYEEIKEFNTSGTPSEALGFSFNPEGFETTLSALYNVKDKYRVALEMGSVDPEEYLALYEQELMDNGLQEYIDAKQAAFDEWRANKP